MNASINLNTIINDAEATATIDQFKDRTDPNYIGPGKWDDIHEEAMNSLTPTSQLNFIKYMKRICRTFPCPTCKTHCNEYIQNHPLEDYLNVTINVDGVEVKLGMFIWTWQFHNAVNKRLGKPIMNYVTAYNMYAKTDNVTCSKACEKGNIALGI